MQEQVSFDPMVESPVTALSIPLLIWLLPCAVAILFFRTTVSAWLRSRADQFSWPKLRWQVPLCGLVPALLMLVAGDSNQGLIVFLAVLNLPGLLPIFLLWWLTRVSDLPQTAVWALAAVSQFGGWYALVRIAEAASSRPASIRAEIDRA